MECQPVGRTFEVFLWTRRRPVVVSCRVPSSAAPEIASSLCQQVPLPAHACLRPSVGTACGSSGRPWHSVGDEGEQGAGCHRWCGTPLDPVLVRPSIDLQETLKEEQEEWRERPVRQCEPWNNPLQQAPGRLLPRARCSTPAELCIRSPWRENARRGPPSRE